MNLYRGDIILVRFPHVAGGRGKKRPVVIVQANNYNRRRRHVIVAEVTGNLAEAADPATLLIEVSTPEGAATGLKRDSLVSCLFLQTLSEDRASQIIGKVSASLLAKLDDCLKASVGDILTFTGATILSHSDRVGTRNNQRFHRASGLLI